MASHGRGTVAFPEGAALHTVSCFATGRPGHVGATTEVSALFTSRVPCWMATTGLSGD